MNLFAISDHFTACCGITPCNNKSAGKRENTIIKKGNYSNNVLFSVMNLDKFNLLSAEEKPLPLSTAIFDVLFKEGPKVALYSHPDFMPRFFHNGKQSYHR